MRRLFAISASLLLFPTPAQALTGDTRAVKVIAEFLGAFKKVHTFQGRIDVLTLNGDQRSELKMILALEKPNKTAMNTSKPTASRRESSKGPRTAE